MANEEHLSIIKKGVTAWNEWRLANPEGEPDLRAATLADMDFSLVNLRNANLESANLYSSLMGADLGQANLRMANLRKCFLRFAYLSKADLSGADFSGADLQEAKLEAAKLYGTKFQGSDLRLARLNGAEGRPSFLEANLSGASLVECRLMGLGPWGPVFRRANLSQTDLTSAILRDANFEGATLIETVLDRANISGAFVYGISVWNVSTVDLIQDYLTISPQRDLNRPLSQTEIMDYAQERELQVSSLELAQFISLLLRNVKIRDIIETVTSKVVLILGRFTEERKPVLDAIHESMRDHGLVPIVFDFPPSPKGDLTETVQLLANMARFVIADLTDAKSIPQELSHIIPNLPSVLIKPIILLSERE